MPTPKSNFVGLLVLLHLLAIGLKALPAPEGAMAKKDWEHPTVQAEFRNWSQQLTQLGFNISPKKLENTLWDWAKSITTIRNQTLRPFRYYYRYVGADQNWRLFVAPHMFPSTLEIDIYEENQWRPIYRKHMPKQWQSTLIEESRFRPAIFRYSWSRYKKQYNRFALYLTEKAALEFPNASQIRFRWWRYPLPSPEDILQKREIMGSYHTELIYPLVHNPNTSEYNLNHSPTPERDLQLDTQPNSLRTK